MTKCLNYTSVIPGHFPPMLFGVLRPHRLNRGAGVKTEQEDNEVEDEILETSWAWWLAPIFLIWLGGLIGWWYHRPFNPRKGNRLLILGIVMTALQGLWLLL